MVKTFSTWELAIVAVFVGLGILHWLALLGEPRSLWLWRDVFGVLQ